MSDLFSPLHTFDARPAALPADDVRRLGDRRRSRRTAMRVGVAACLLAAIGGLVTVWSSPDSEIDPARLTPSLDGEDVPAPEPSPASLIPGRFPLAVGLPPSSVQADLRGADRTPFPDVVPPVCGSRYVLPGDPVDRLAIEGTNPDFQGVRDLAVFGTSAEARRAVADRARILEGCPRERNGSTRAATEVTPLALGDQGWRALRTFRLEGQVIATEVTFLVQQGPAVLVLSENTSDDEALGDPERWATRYQQEQLDPVAQALCEVRTVC